MKLWKSLNKNKKLSIVLAVLVGLIILVGAVEIALWLNDKPPPGWHDASDIKLTIDDYETSLQAYISNRLRIEPLPVEWDSTKEFYHIAEEIRIEENGNYTSLKDYIETGFVYDSKYPWVETTSWHSADKIRVNYQGKHYSLQELADQHSLRNLLEDEYDVEFYQGQYLDNFNRVNPEKNRIPNPDLKGNPNAEESDCSIEALSARRPYANSMCDAGTIPIGIAYKKTYDALLGVGKDRTDSVGVVCAPYQVKEIDRKIIIDYGDYYVAGDDYIQNDFLTRTKMHNIYRDADYAWYIIKNVLPTVISVFTGGFGTVAAGAAGQTGWDIAGNALTSIVNSFTNSVSAICMDNPFRTQRYSLPSQQVDMSGIQEVSTDACAANCHNAGASCTGTIPTGGSGKPSVDCSKQCLPVTLDNSLSDDLRKWESGNNPNEIKYIMCPNTYTREETDDEEDEATTCEDDEDCESDEVCNTETGECEAEEETDDETAVTGSVISGFVSKIVGLVTGDEDESDDNYVLIGIKYESYWEDETLTCRMCSTDDIDSYTAICAKIDEKGRIDYRKTKTIANSDFGGGGESKSLKCKKGEVAIGISTKDRVATKGISLFGECRAWEVDQNDGATPVCIKYHPFS